MAPLPISVIQPSTKKTAKPALFQKGLGQRKKGEKSDDELQNIADLERHENDIINDDIVQLLSTYLIWEAEKYLLSVPTFDLNGGKWERSDVSYRYRLSPEAIRELRDALRKEKKESSELARSWLTGLTGLIGVLIGLVAVILGRR